jgi:hypothetical protein
MWNVVGAERTSTSPNRIVIYYRVDHKVGQVGANKKTFYFYIKKSYRFILLYLVLALESISGVKSWFFFLIHPE